MCRRPRPLVQKKIWRDSLPIDMLLSAVSVLVVAQSISEIPDGLMNNPVYYLNFINLASKCYSYFRILMFSFDSTETK
jgi:hypothetical protein